MCWETKLICLRDHMERRSRGSFPKIKVICFLFLFYLFKKKEFSCACKRNDRVRHFQSWRHSWGGGGGGSIDPNGWMPSGLASLVPTRFSISGPAMLDVIRMCLFFCFFFPLCLPSITWCTRTGSWMPSRSPWWRLPQRWHTEWNPKNKKEKLKSISVCHSFDLHSVMQMFSRSCRWCLNK